MAKTLKRVLQGGLLATLGLGALSSVQQAGLALGAGAAALWATPALAQSTVPGVGQIIKCGCSPPPKGKSIYAVVAPTDSNGVVNLSGLIPGDYEVKLVGDSASVTIQVGADGKLTTVAQEDKGRRWVEPASRSRDTSAAFAARAADIIDVNTATPEALMRGTANTREAAAFIVSERQRSGPYKSPLDFAQRVGPRVTADFSAVAVRIGDTTIFPRGTDPSKLGFKTAAGSGVVTLYGQTYPYVGHVTLLK